MRIYLVNHLLISTDYVVFDVDRKHRIFSDTVDWFLSLDKILYLKLWLIDKTRCSQELGYTRFILATCYIFRSSSKFVLQNIPIPVENFDKSMDDVVIIFFIDCSEEYSLPTIWNLFNDCFELLVSIVPLVEHT